MALNELRRIKDKSTFDVIMGCREIQLYLNFIAWARPGPQPP